MCDFLIQKADVWLANTPTQNEYLLGKIGFDTAENEPFNFHKFSSLQGFNFHRAVVSHQVVEDGYEFFAQRQLVTLFSAPNYCGEFDNSGAVMSVDASLMCSFHILKPRSAAPGTPDTVGRGGR